MKRITKGQDCSSATLRSKARSNLGRRLADAPYWATSNRRGTIDDLRAILLRQLPRAFRRDVEKGEVEPFVALAQQALDEGLPFEQSLRRGLKAVLCSPEFLFLEERGDQASATIDDFALASRLSYFLWRSLPDETLLTLARRGELQKPQVRRAELERMLRDPKAERFITSFTGQWLRLDDIDFTVPNDNLYPEYNELLRQSMLDETRGFFREILDRDLGVQNFIDSDFVMINEPLAEFYSIDGVAGIHIRRVERRRAACAAASSRKQACSRFRPTAHAHRRCCVARGS